jgi:hypothetical protein
MTALATKRSRPPAMPRTNLRPARCSTWNTVAVELGIASSSPVTRLVAAKSESFTDNGWMVRVTDDPLAPGGRAYLFERGLEVAAANANAALQALIADYVRQASVLDEVPMAAIPF